MINENIILKIALSKKIKSFSKLMKKCDSLEELSDNISSILSKKDLQDIKESLNVKDLENTKGINYYSDNYPSLLAKISAPPFKLFYKGDLSLLNSPCVAIVGSRECTEYGLSYTDKIVRILVEKGYTIVSGLARGIDSKAHSSALKYGGNTIAVLGWGIDYKSLPLQQMDLLNNIIKNSLAISEFLPSTHGSKLTFPIRNRIISGLSTATIMAEAKTKSGSMITAEYAFTQRRDLLVIPGRINDESYSGCLKLASLNKARVINDLNEFSKEFPMISGNRKIENISRPVTNIYLTESESKIINFIKRNSPCHLDQILRNGELEISEVPKTLLKLQLDGLITRLPGNNYKVELP